MPRLKPRRLMIVTISILALFLILHSHSVSVAPRFRTGIGGIRPISKGGGGPKQTGPKAAVVIPVPAFVPEPSMYETEEMQARGGFIPLPAQNQRTPCGTDLHGSNVLSQVSVTPKQELLPKDMISEILSIAALKNDQRQKTEDLLSGINASIQIRQGKIRKRGIIAGRRRRGRRWARLRRPARSPTIRMELIRVTTCPVAAVMEGTPDVFDTATRPQSYFDALFGDHRRGPPAGSAAHRSDDESVESAVYLPHLGVDPSNYPRQLESKFAKQAAASSARTTATACPHQQSGFIVFRNPGLGANETADAGEAEQSTAEGRA